MAEELFTLRVLTPAGLLFEEQVTGVSLPASDGEIGVLPGHTRYTGLLGVGILSYQSAHSGSAGAKSKSLVISGGFCSFVDGKLTVLADAVDTVESLERAQVAKMREEGLKALESLSAYDDAWSSTATKVQRAEAAEKLLGVSH